MSTTIASNPAQPTTIAHRLIRATGPIMSPFAGRRWFPLWAILEHRGRKSGRVYRTPIVARRTPDGFVIPMPFGEATDWVRNVLAAGTCAITWKGHRYELDHPETIDRRAAAPAFGGLLGRMLPVVGIEQFMRVQVPETR